MKLPLGFNIPTRPTLATDKQTDRQTDNSCNLVTQATSLACASWLANTTRSAYDFRI